MEYRVILFHKQATSARTRFLLFANQSVLAFEPLPELAQVMDAPTDTVMHPAMVLKKTAERLGLEEGDLEAEGEYVQAVDVPNQTVQVILAAITTTDPPFELAEKMGARFIDLTQARGLPRVELELLRAAYEVVLGG